MAVRRKGNKWQVDVTWQGIRAPRVSAETEQEAKRIEADFKAQLMAGKMPEPPKRSGPPARQGYETLAGLAHYTVQNRWKGTKGEATAEYNAYSWVDALGEDYPVEKITPVVIDEVAQRWADSVKVSTINRKIAALSVMLNTARDLGVPVGNFKVKQRKEYGGRLRWFTDDELHSLEAFFADDRDMLDLIVLATHTGFRFGELINTTPRDYSVSTGKLSTWVTKGDEPRSVPLTPRAKEIVMRRRTDVRDWELLFPVTLNSSAVSRRMRAWKKAYGLPEGDEACFHTFRHTCCSRLVQRGVSLPVVQKWMGHATIQTTMRYAHLAPDALDDALAALS